MEGGGGGEGEKREYLMGTSIWRRVRLRMFGGDGGGDDSSPQAKGWRWEVGVVGWWWCGREWSWRLG
jgi:hypothetical protein